MIEKNCTFPLRVISAGENISRWLCEGGHTIAHIRIRKRSKESRMINEGCVGLTGPSDTAEREPERLRCWWLKFIFTLINTNEEAPIINFANQQLDVDVHQINLTATLDDENNGRHTPKYEDWDWSSTRVYQNIFFALNNVINKEGHESDGF